MNKIYSTFCKAGILSPTSPSLTSPVKSDTDRDSGFLLYRFSSIIQSLLDHMVGIDVYPNSHLSSQNSIDNNIIITSKVLLLTRRWGGISA